MEITTLDTICLFLIILIGLPHGAIDGPLLVRATRLRDNYNFHLFSYLSAGIGFWFFWANFPNIALLIFLTISVAHFGLGDVRNHFQNHNVGTLEKFVAIFSHGGLVPIVIPIFHPEKTFFIFRMLGGTHQFFHTFFLISFIFWCATLAVFCIIAFQDPLWKKSVYEVIVLAIVCHQLDPIISFTFYFCGIHTWRHIISIKQLYHSLEEFYQAIKKSLPFIIITFIIIAGLITHYILNENIKFNGSLIKTTFILLASLTVPHMIFIDKFIHNR